ncbi:membrane protein [Streptomyces sp. e14]|nr:membrane protein [Streptomyces sp. e14]
MRPDDRGQGGGRRDGQGGIPDGLLIGLLAFLLGMTVLVWTATGLAGLFSHGSWPHAVSFTRTPLAMRHLVAEPHDVPGAWPDTPPAALSGYGLFWGLFIGQLMVLFVLTVFVLGTVTRWRAGRARRRAEVAAARQGAPAPGHGTLPEPHEPPAHHEVPGQRTAAVPAPAQDPFPALQQPAPARPPAPETPVREAPVREGLAQEAHVREPYVQEALTAGAEPPLVPSPEFLEPPRPTVVVAPRERPPRPGRPGDSRRGRTRPRRHLEPGAVAGHQGLPRQTRPGPPLRPHAPVRHPGPAALVAHGGLRGQADRPGPGHRPARPGPPHREDRPGGRRNRRDAAAQLPARRRHRRPHHPPRPPLVPGDPAPGRRTDPAHQPEGGRRLRGRAGGRAHRAPRTPGHRAGTDEPCPGLALHGERPRSLHSPPN